MSYEESDIKEIVTSVTDIIRQSSFVKTQGTFWSWLSNRTNLVPKADSKVPVFYEEYPLITGQAERIRIHAEPGIFPDELFLVRSPNMTEDEFKYIKANFKNTSNPVFLDGHTLQMKSVTMEAQGQQFSQSPLLRAILML